MDQRQQFSLITIDAIAESVVPPFSVFRVDRYLQGLDPVQQNVNIIGEYIVLHFTLVRYLPSSTIAPIVATATPTRHAMASSSVTARLSAIRLAQPPPSKSRATQCLQPSI